MSSNVDILCYIAAVVKMDWPVVGIYLVKAWSWGVFTGCVVLWKYMDQILCFNFKGSFFDRKYFVCALFPLLQKRAFI